MLIGGSPISSDHIPEHSVITAHALGTRMGKTKKQKLCLIIGVSVIFYALLEKFDI